MILTAKTNLPLERPLHLFGAGHPHMLSLAVALGCDLFDSAAYALYARDGRYMTENGTWRIGELDYFPCQCPKCATSTPKAVLEMPKAEREVFLAEHNLHVCIAELKRIKQAIRDGRLWEHVEMRMHAHPALLTALKKVKNYEGFIERHSPTIKQSGLFFYDSVGLSRPEVVHYRRRLAERYHPPQNATALLLVPQTRNKPFHRGEELKETRRVLRTIGELSNQVHMCFYAAPFGVIPLELDEVYPLSQHETVMPLDQEVIDYVAAQVNQYIQRSTYQTVVLLHDANVWGNTVKQKSKVACEKKKIKFDYINVDQSCKGFLAGLEEILRKNIGE